MSLIIQKVSYRYIIVFNTNTARVYYENVQNLISFGKCVYTVYQLLNGKLKIYLKQCRLKLIHYGQINYHA